RRAGAALAGRQPHRACPTGLAVRGGALLSRRSAALSAAGGGRVTTTIESPLKGLVGDKTAKALAAHLDLHTAGDLLYYFPRRYDERGEHTDIRALQVGEQVTVLAQVQRTNVRPMRARRGQLLEVTVGDGTGGLLTCTFFNQAWRERDLKPGRW